MTLTIELPEALAELVRAESLARHCSEGDAAVALLGERLLPINLDELEKSLLDPMPGEPIPLTRGLIEDVKAYARSVRRRATAA